MSQPTAKMSSCVVHQPPIAATHGGRCLRVEAEGGIQKRRAGALPGVEAHAERLTEEEDTPDLDEALVAVLRRQLRELDRIANY